MEMRRDEALSFCQNNNATLFFWNNANEQDRIQSSFFFLETKEEELCFVDEMIETISKLFRYQIDERRNDTLNFYVGLKRIKSIKQWEDNVISLFFLSRIFYLN